jgi:hypothetical protein
VYPIVYNLHANGILPLVLGEFSSNVKFPHRVFKNKIKW